METHWNLKPAERQLAVELAYELDIPIAAATVYIARGLDNVEKIDEFTKLGIGCLHNPWLLPDIKPVIDRLNYALDNGQKIFCWGDYDVDGVTATSVVVTALKKMKANLEYYVPHRINDGYDIKVPSIEKAVAANADLLMSVDCGIVAFEAAARAKELGLDLIITDHHEPSADGRIPDCIGVVNPNRHDSTYPFPSLAGVGIAFKVMCALAQSRGLSVKELVGDLLEYVALGTVADVAPMIDENRTLVYLGCKRLTNTEKAGVKELLKVAGVNTVNTTAIGFGLGPRINAIGRLADSGTALDLLLERSENRAKFLAQQLDTANRRRQTLQEQVVKEAIALVEEENDMEHTRVIVVAARGWHPGLIGLVAGKLAEHYGRPALVCTIGEDGKAKGSCRSTRDFNILAALKSEEAWKQFLRRGDGSVVCGGHAFAAGFTLPAENIPALRQALNDYANNLGMVFEKRIIDIDCRINPGDINEQTFKAISRLSPFGSHNPEPVFLARKMNVVSANTLGEGGKHLKLRLKGNGAHDPIVQALAWRWGSEAEKYGEGTQVDVVFKLGMEEFRGQTNLTMTVEDMRPSE